MAQATARVDAWLWAVRIYKTRTLATAACRAGHVRINGDRAKPAHAVRVGDELRVRTPARERILIVREPISKRVGAVAAAAAVDDRTPAPPPREEHAHAGVRDRGTGRPTKRDRRAIERLRGRR